MPRFLKIAIVSLAAGLAGFAGQAARAQVSSSGLLPPNVLRRNGLDRVWYTQIEVDRGRGHVVHVTPYVNHARSVKLFEVKFGRRQYLFSELDVDPLGKTLGPEGAQLAADNKIAELKSQYPEATDEPVATMIVSPEITLYATTSRGTVHAIDGETGRTRWVTNVGNSAYPTTEAAANDEFVTVVNGTTLYVLRSLDGDFRWQKRMSGVPAAGAAMSSEYVFVPMVSGAIESYTLLEPKTQPWIYKSLGRSMVRPAAGLGSLAWPTDRGHMYVAKTTNNRDIRYRLEAREVIVSSPVFNAPDRLLVASVDGYVHCLNPFRQTSNISWQFSTGESISQSPVCFGDVVYVATDNRRLFAISRNNGLPVWESAVTGIKTVLAASKDHLYAVGNVGRLVILDTVTGAQLSDIQTIEYDLHVQNPVTDRLYIGSRGGLIQCLRETQQYWPLLHQPPEKSAAPKPKVIQQPAAGDDPAAQPGMEDDPFGAPGARPKPPVADDPFGGPAGKPAPKPKVPDDPFG